MYEIDTKVRYSECGEDGKLRLAALINYFQDASSAHSESLGVGVAYLKEKKRAWILNTWQIILGRLPKAQEEIVVATWPTGFKGVFGPRNFTMTTKGGEQLACANTLWVYIDTESYRPAKPDEEEMQTYGVEEALVMPPAPRKIRVPEGAALVDRERVHRYQIDTNGHMNNSQYIQLAAELVPETFVAGELRVEYRKSAMYGDIILLKRAEETGRIVVELCDEDEKPYAVVEFLEAEEKDR